MHQMQVKTQFLFFFDKIKNITNYKIIFLLLIFCLRDKVRQQKKRYREKALKRKQQENANNPNAQNETPKPAKVVNPKSNVKNGEKAKDDKRKKFEEFSKK